MLLDDNHTMQIQWDGSLIEKGFKDIETRFKNLDNLTAKTQRKVKVEGSHDIDKAHTKGIIEDRKRALKEQQQLGRELAAEKTREARKEIAHEQALAMHKRQSAVAEANALRQEATLLTENRRIAQARHKIDSQMAGLKGSNSPQAKAQMAALEKHIKHLKNAQDLLNSSVKKGDRQFLQYKETLQDTITKVTRLNKTTTAITRNFNAQKFAADGLGQSLKNMARSWISVFAVIGGVGFLKRTAQDMESIGVASLLASGSAKQSAKDLEFVKDLTHDLGLRFKDTAKAFATFNVAALSSGVSGEKAREVFINISEALAGSATSAESAKLAFLGFRQMMSGSVVQAQEINQIVDQMPAFYGAAKDALVEMGYEVSQVADDGKKSFKDTFKLMGVDAKKFVDLSAKIMSEQARQTGALAKFKSSISAEETRMINARDVAIDKMAASGLDDMFKNIFGGLANLIKAVTPALTALGYTFGRLAEYIALPFRMLGKLAELLGAEEGEGITRVIQLLSTFLIPLLISGLAKMSIVLGGAAAKAMGLSAGLFTASKAGFTFAGSLMAIRSAATLLMKRFLPLYLLMEGLTFLYDKFSGGDTSLEIKNLERSVSNKTASSSNQPTFHVENLQVTSGDGGNAREIAEDVVKEFRDMAHSSFPLV